MSIVPAIGGRSDLPASCGPDRTSAPSAKPPIFKSHRSPIPYLLPSWSQLCKRYLNFYVITHIEDSRWNNRPSHLSDAPEVECLDWERCLLRNDPMGALMSAKLKIRTRVMELPTTKTLEVKQEDLEKQKWVSNSGGQAGTGSPFLNIHLDYNSTRATCNVDLDVLGRKRVLMGI